MLKFTLITLFCLSQLFVMAQKSAESFHLYLQREINGIVQIVDTSFSSKVALDAYLDKLEPLDLKGDSSVRVKMFRFQDSDDVIHFKGGLQPADSMINHNKAITYTFSFSSDSTDNPLKKHRAGERVVIHSNVFPEGLDSSSFRFEFDKSKHKMSMELLEEVIKEKNRAGTKTLTLTELEEKEVLPTAVKAKVGLNKQPLQLQSPKIFPNSGDGLVQLSFKLKNTAQLKVNVFNEAGQPVFTDSIAEFSGVYLSEIDLRKAVAGTYYLYISHGTKSAVRKIRIN